MDQRERDCIEHLARSDERWGDQWRTNKRVGDDMSDCKERVDGLEGWRYRVKGQFAVYAFFGAVGGGVLAVVLSRLFGG